MAFIVHFAVKIKDIWMPTVFHRLVAYGTTNSDFEAGQNENTEYNRLLIQKFLPKKKLSCTLNHSKITLVTLKGIVDIGLV